MVKIKKKKQFIQKQKIKLIQNRLISKNYIGSNWIKIAQSTCGSGYKCVNSSNFTSESDYINPCISETTCTGTVQVITEDRNDNPMQNLLVSRDEVLLK